MKKFNSFFVTAALLFACQTAWAYDFAVDGIYYNITSRTEPLTVEVTYKTYDGNSYTGAVVIPNSVTYDGNVYNVTCIGEDAFEECEGVRSIQLPDGLTSVINNSFDECLNLKFNQYDNAYYLGSASNPYLYLCKAISEDVVRCKVNDQCRFIGSSAFVDCRKLQSVTLSAGLTEIGDDAFYDCSKLFYNQLDNAYYLGSADNPYLYLAKAVSKDIASCSMSDQCRFIGSYAFEECSNMSSISLPAGLIGIAAEAFANCQGLSALNLPAGLTTIGFNAFRNCIGLTTVSIPAGVTHIGVAAFDGCKGLTAVTMLEGVNCIGDGAFVDCTNLASVFLPQSVARMGEGAFTGCSALTKLVCKAVTPPSLTKDYLDSYGSFDASKCSLYVPRVSVNVYASADWWKNFANILALEDDPSAIESVHAVEQEGLVFDLNGRRLGASAKQGVMIQNGKKMLTR